MPDSVAHIATVVRGIPIDTLTDNAVRPATNARHATARVSHKCPTSQHLQLKVLH